MKTRVASLAVAWATEQTSPCWAVWQALHGAESIILGTVAKGELPPNARSPPRGVASTVSGHDDHRPVRQGHDRKAVVFKRHIDAELFRDESPMGRAANVQGSGLLREGLFGNLW